MAYTMAYTINHATIEKLLHPIQEIRVRSLHDIENTLKLALWRNAEIGMNAIALFKNLIRWFAKSPLCEEVVVLELMLLLLESKYGVEIMKFYSRDRITKELTKIHSLIGSDIVYDQLVNNVMHQVYRRIESSTDSGSEQDVDSVADSMGTMQLDGTGLSNGDSREHRVSIVDSFAARWKGDPTFYTECWEVPDMSVRSVLGRLNDSLFEEEDRENFNRAVNYVIPYTKDNPPEFFLQPPYIGLSLLRLIQLQRIDLRKGFNMLLHLVESFRKRIRQRMLTVAYMPMKGERRRTQLSFGAFVYEIFRLGIEQLKELSGEGVNTAANMILIVLSQTTAFLMAEHFCELQKIPASRFGELCRDLGYLVKHYRQEWESDTKRAYARTHYRITMQIMLDFVRLWQKEPELDATGGLQASRAALGAMANYSATDYATFNSTAHRKALEQADGTWRDECQLALLDYPLKLACPEMYEHLCTHVGKENEHLLAALVELRKKMFHAVQLLRDGTTGNAKLTDETLLAKGLEAIGTLCFHRSSGMVRSLLKAVDSCAGTVTEDGPLWDIIESITVRLLAHADEKIRCEVYDMCAKMMKDFIGQLDDGAILTRRSLFSSSSPKLRAMGMPLSVQILTEITCFGYTSTNVKIKQCAETMLLFLLNSKAFLREKWIDVQELLLPIAPLVQTVAVGREESQLRRVVIGMFHPDFGLPFLDLLQGNLRFLYHEESAIREEALTRVLFLVSSVEQSDKFTPRIEHISDTVPNGVCLLSFPFDIACHKTANVYDVSSVKPLVDVLEQEGGDPAMRRSALTQLNVLAEDPVLCEVIHSSAGWSTVLRALYNSMRTDKNHLDYPDAAFPAVGILNKLCFRSTKFRRFLGANMNACHMIVRALLMHHHMPVFRLDCCALLYLLLFADCATGDGPFVSLPVMCATSAYKIPFVSQFHWRCSPMREFSQLELLFHGNLPDDFAPEQDAPAESILRVEGGKKKGAVMNGGESVLSNNDSSATIAGGTRSAIWEYVKRYVRFTFADLWYEGLDKIQGKVNGAARSGTTNADEDEETPPEYKGNKSALDFSPRLRLTKQDMRWLKVIDFPSIIRKSVRRLSSAKAHEDVYGGLAMLEVNLSFPLKNIVPHQDIIINALKRYLHTPPVSVDDQELLEDVFNVIDIMLHLDLRMVRSWLLAVLETDANFFLRLLRSDDCIESLHTKNANLLLRLLQQQDDSKRLNDPEQPQQQQQQSEPPAGAWEVRLFNAALAQLDVVLKLCDLPRIISLVEVLQAMAGRVEGGRIDIVVVVPKLLHCIRLIKSTTYSGSAIIRSCLLAVAHLLEHSPHELGRMEWKSRQLRTIATQCSNSNTLARSFAWNILAKIARTVGGAAAIVKECAYLPGGIHASCVSTVLDTREASLVKESAVGLLVKLLCHCSTGSVDPLDGATFLRKALGGGGASATPPVTKSSLELVMELLVKQRFFEESVRSLEHYTCMEFVLDGDMAPTAVIVSADLVKAYAVLFRCLIELDPIVFGKLLFEKGCVQGLLECVEMQAVLPNRAVCLMVAEVCTLLMRCLDEPNQAYVCELLAGHQTFVESVIYVLNPYLYGKLTQPVMEITLCSIMRFLCPFVLTPSGKHQVHLEFGQKDVKPIAKMIENAIRHKSPAFETICSRFVALMISTSDLGASPTAEYPSFLIQFETMDMFTEDDELAKPVKAITIEEDSELEDDTENTNPNRPSVASGATDEKQTKPTRGKVALRSASALIFEALTQRYELSCSREQLEAGGVTTSIYKRTLYSTIQTMLHYSGQACRVARARNLLGIVLKWFDAIHEGLIGRLSYTEFVRRHGESKKQYVMAELKELASVLGAWFSLSDEALLLHMNEIDELCQMVLMYWPWFTNHHVLLLEILQVLGFLTESHIIMCKALAATFPGYSHSIMKLLIVTATTETAKVKGPKCDLQVLKLSLRVLRNCCCCHEGRNTIGKLNVFDNLSKLHPSVTKLQKPWLEVTQVWLEFWEVYTRYIDVSEVRHLTVLGALVRKSGSEMRLLALAIIRNLTFVLANRPALLASSDYMFILQNALQRTSSEMEVLMAAVTVWKMIANNQRGKAAIKSSALVRLIAGQVKHYSMTPEGNDQNELWNVLMTVYRILGA